MAAWQHSIRTPKKLRKKRLLQGLTPGMMRENHSPSADSSIAAP